MNPLRTLIVDDEALARQGIAHLLKADPDIEVVGEYEDGRSALAAILAGRPDLVFLDIQMPQGGGLELLEALPPGQRPAIIFVTAHLGHAVRAFELSAVDYVMKPFSDQRLRAALARAKEQVSRADFGEMQRQTRELLERLRRLETAQAAPGPGGHGARIVFRTGGEHLFMAVGDIAWIEAQGASVKVRAAGGEHLVRESLQAVEQRLDPAVFVRIHRSFIVNTGVVRKITPARYGDHVVWTTDGARLPMSRTYRDKLSVLLASRPA